ncbi:hypothetical protein LFREDSHE_09740 [Shewanella baltica]
MAGSRIDSKDQWMSLVLSYDLALDIGLRLIKAKLLACMAYADYSLLKEVPSESNWLIRQNNSTIPVSSCAFGPH